MRPNKVEKAMLVSWLNRYERWKKMPVERENRAWYRDGFYDGYRSAIEQMKGKK